MLEEEKAELLERRLAEALHTRVEGVLIRRYSIYGAIAALILTSFIGLSVREVLSNATKELERAKIVQQSAATQMEDTAIKSKVILLDTKLAIEEAKKDVEGRFDIIDEAANRLEIRLAEAAGNNISISENIRVEMKKLSDQLAIISDVVQNLARANDKTRKFVLKAGKAREESRKVDENLQELQAHIEQAIEGTQTKNVMAK